MSARKADTGARLVAARRNLREAAAHAEAWEQAHREQYPMRYRMHTADGAYNIKCGRSGLIREIREQKPHTIKRLPMNGEAIVFPKPPGLIFGPLALEVGHAQE